MKASVEILNQEFASLADAIGAHAVERPEAIALMLGEETVDYGTLYSLMQRVAYSLQREGVVPQSTIAICAQTSLNYAVVLLGAVMMGVTVAPLVVTSTPETLATMISDADAKLLFVDGASRSALSSLVVSPRMVDLEPLRADASWLAPKSSVPQPVEVRPEWAFNILYSSGTTGVPKGIIQTHALRWGVLRQQAGRGLGTSTVALAATPLYSNITLMSALPTLARGGSVVLMDKFDAGAFLELAQLRRVTYAVLVPIQYRRILDHPSFDSTDLSSFQSKSCAGAPCPPTLKREIAQRWPGHFFDVYGMTEGGAVCVLSVTERPDKVHTVGKPLPGHEIFIVDEQGSPLPDGQHGEIVGHSYNMMSGYHRQPEKTLAAEWRSPDGRRFIRTGDVGYIDPDGFLVLIDRKKDMIISGGFNIYSSDLEAVLSGCAGVREAAVIGVPSERWGETPIGFVVPEKGCLISATAIQEEANARLGKTQRLSEVIVIPELPRNQAGKVLKRDLRELHARQSACVGTARAVS
ncbi:class I adenylate-forming enzyme family protein [Bradyrhizobium liaoningense]|uniref:class I adenylate-forming enzyme family protein n=1 Tax=Bradyrhizobium liaoningense TaxID=43992 RepID=UPI001BA6D59A|nr:class I adenylate-forming enzyme family protein [Bradyrhizobium liaoningense]MBR0987999.1 acyl--CoA ligase [Bradyrhizobium liaoningense]